MAIQPRLDQKLTIAQPVLYKAHEDLIAEQVSARNLIVGARKSYPSH